MKTRYLVGAFGNTVFAIGSFFIMKTLSLKVTVESFGLYNYILAILSPLVILLSGNTINTYTTFVNRYENDFSLKLSYLFFSALILTISILFFNAFNLGTLLKINHLGISLNTALVGVYAYVILRQIAIANFEASNHTSTNIAIQLIAVVIINYILYKHVGTDTEILNVTFTITALFYLLFYVASLIFHHNLLHLVELRRLTKHIRLYVSRSIPVFLSAIIVNFALIFDRFISLHFSDLTQQSYFSASQRIVIILSILLASVTNIFWKDITVFTKKFGTDKSILFLKVFLLNASIPILMASFNICLYSDTILEFVFDERYVAASASLQIMAFYPVLQLYVTYIGIFLYNSSSLATIGKASIISALISTLFLLFLLNFFNGVEVQTAMAMRFVLSNILLISIYVALGKGKISLLFRSVPWYKISLGLFIFAGLSFIFRSIGYSLLGLALSLLLVFLITVYQLRAFFCQVDLLNQDCVKNA